jgi:hypothetical protein
MYTLYWVKCDGEAHDNPYIDNCWTCAPFWEKIPRCTCGCDGKRMRVTDKHIICPACKQRYPRPK